MFTITILLFCTVLSIGVHAEEVDPPMHGPVSCRYCHKVNESGSHFTHVYSERGSHMICTNCHNTNGPNTFKDGKSFSETTICDTCHSPDGTFDGINDPIIGAKPNWENRIYDTDNLKLKVGKEKWCAGCHDNVPSLINGVKAPNVTGDDVDYGYYVTGHGKHSNMTCGYCHNLSSKHIDGEARTYSANDLYTTYSPVSDAYQSGYRLKDVLAGYNGKYPMHMPRTGHVYPPGFREDWEFALCFECHNSTKLFNGGSPTTGEGAETNFRMLIDGGGGNPVPIIGQYYSLHNVHTWGANGPGAENPQYDSDFNGIADSRMSCPSCHNVHGSRSPTMVRTGELERKVPALNLKYVNNAKGYALSFISRNLLTQSTGAGMDVSFGQGTIASNSVCNMCHAQQTGGPEPHTAYYRSPITISSTKCTVCHPD